MKRIKCYLISAILLFLSAVFCNSSIGQTVTYPSSAGIIWYSGLTYDITWINFPGQNVKIELYRGTDLIGALVSETANDGLYSWQVSRNYLYYLTSTDYKIRITSADNAAIYDNSDNNFKIMQQRITYPVENVAWFRDNTYIISWVDFPGSNVKIELIGVEEVNYIITPSTPNDGSFSWTIPDTDFGRNKYDLKITSTENTSIYARVYSKIGIYNPEVREPSEPGMTFIGGKSYMINWFGFPGNSVKIDLYKGTSLYDNITLSTYNDVYEDDWDNFYRWEVPNIYPSASDYYIRISDPEDPSCYVVSDYSFTITKTKTLGNTEVYSSSSATNQRRAQIVTFPESGTIENISIYHNGGTGQLLLGVYSDVNGTPGTRLGVTSATTISSSEGWQTVSLISPVTIATGQSVWLAYVFENDPGVRYIAGTPPRAQSMDSWSGGMPESFGSSIMANYKYSFFCTYIPDQVLQNTLGNTEVYSSSSATNQRRAQIVTFPESGTIESISIYHNGGTGKVLLGVYSDVNGTPGTRLGVTSATDISSSAGWQTVSLISPLPVISGQNVWLAYVFENDPGVRYIAGSPPRAQSMDTWAGGMPDSFESSIMANYKYSLYCTYIDEPALTKPKTVGNTVVYSSTSSSAYRKAIPVTFQEAGTIHSISIYHECFSMYVLLGVYEDVNGVPLTRLGVTNDNGSVGNKGWTTLLLQNPVSVQAGQKLWLAWVFEGGGRS